MIQDGFILVDKPEGWTSFKTDRFVGNLLGTGIARNVMVLLQGIKVPKILRRL